MRILIPALLCLLVLSSVGQSVAIQFEVDMRYQVAKGTFDPAVDYVDIAGSFNDWGENANVLQDDDTDTVWSTTIQNFQAGQVIDFKFRINGSWDGREEFPGGGPNRTLTVASDDQTLFFTYGDETAGSDVLTAGFSSSKTYGFVGDTILFTAVEAGAENQYSWYFEGGTPSTSDSFEVGVTYEATGTYGVSLKVANEESSDSVFMDQHVAIRQQSRADLDWWNDEVFYEIFVRSFYDSDGDGVGDLQGIIEKLDYLNDGDPATQKDLGITAIWLMPIHESPTYHGYDVKDYRSINPDYGTMSDFKELVEKAHQRGIKIIIDLVLNHSSTEIEWFREASSSVESSKRDWYIWSDENPGFIGPWGQNVWHSSNTGYYYGIFWQGMPDLNFDNEDLKQEMFDITRFWLEEVGIDGYRLDAVKFIKEDSSTLEDLPSTHDFWRDWVAYTKEVKPEAVSVGEAWTQTDNVIPYVFDEGLDFCFEFDLGYAIVDAARTGASDLLIAQTKKVIDSYPYYQFGTFTTNHDMNRLMNELSSDEKLVKLAAAAYLTLPGVPFIYYGEEVGMLGVKPDENIRRPMPWTSGNNAGFSEVRPWNSPPGNYRTNNVADQLTTAESLLSWYRKLIQTRHEIPALRTGTYEELDQGFPGLFAFKRSLSGEEVIVLINFGDADIEIEIQPGEFSLTGEETHLVNLLSETDKIAIESSSILVNVESGTAMLLRPEKVLSTEKEEPFELYPNPASEKITIVMKGGFSYRLVSLEGRELLHGSTSSDRANVDLAGLKPGPYILWIENGKDQFSKTIMNK